MSRTTYTASQLPFVADVHTLVRNTGRQIDWAQVPDSTRQGYETVTVTSAGINAAGVTSFVCDPLPGPIPSGTTLYFGQTGEFVLTTAYAAAGATAIPCQATPQAIEDNDTAVYTVPSANAKVLSAGTIMVEVASGLVVPYANRPGSEEATMILESGATAEDSKIGATGYGCLIGGVIYSNLLPDAAHASFTTMLANLRANGAGFVFETYADSRSA